MLFSGVILPIFPRKLSKALEYQRIDSVVQRYYFFMKSVSSVYYIRIVVTV